MKFIVIYDDGMGIMCPLSWCDKCKGALADHAANEPVAVFSNREAARKAIRISRCYVKLQIAKGEEQPDMLALWDKSMVRIVPLSSEPQP